jgi:hypothetical protein
MSKRLGEDKFGNAEPIVLDKFLDEHFQGGESHGFMLEFLD